MEINGGGIWLFNDLNVELSWGPCTALRDLNIGSRGDHTKQERRPLL